MIKDVHLLFSIITGVALIPLIARKLKTPSAALEIVFGMFLFSTIFPVKPQWFLVMKEMGLIYLMFIAGMEFDAVSILKGKRVYWYVAIPLLSLIVMPGLFNSLGYPFFLGIVVSAMSAGIVVPVLKESGLIKTPLGIDVIGIALTGEFLSIIGLTGIEIYTRYGLNVSGIVHAIKLLLLMVAGALFLKILYVLAWWHPERVEHIMESKDPVEEGMRAVIFVAFGGAFIANYSGVEPLLGSFMAGVIFSIVFKNKGRFEDKVNSIGFGFLVPFFFIGVGANFNINTFHSLPAIQLSVFLCLMIFAGRMFTLLFARLMNLSLPEALGISLLLSAPLSLMVTAGTVGTKIGIINDTMKDSIVLAAIFASITYPSLFRIIAAHLSKAGPAISAGRTG